MGANAATKAFRVVENLERILAIELFNAAQAIDFRRPNKTSMMLEDFLGKYRELVPFVIEDKVMHFEIQKTINFLQNVTFEMEDALMEGI
jgi:histidine ammonia-lyase